MIYLTPVELVRVAQRVVGAELVVRDRGLLESAAARPQATGFGSDAYPSLEVKAAALVHSLARDRPLVDGNKGLALAAVVVFLGVNGRRLTLTNDEAHELTMAVAAGGLDDVTVIAERIRTATLEREV